LTSSAAIRPAAGAACAGRPMDAVQQFADRDHADCAAFFVE
jgi:hypothetical protein